MQLFYAEGSWLELVFPEMASAVGQLRQGDIMTASKLKERPSRVQNEWYSAARQSARDHLRMGWARHVLEEES